MSMDHRPWPLPDRPWALACVASVRAGRPENLARPRFESRGRASRSDHDAEELFGTTTCVADGFEELPRLSLHATPMV